MLNISAQVDSVRLNGEYLKYYWTDSRDIVISPIKWDKKDLRRFGLFAATTTALVLVDKPLYNFVRDNKTEKLESFSHDVLNPLGANYSVVLGGAFYLFGEIGEK